MEKLKKKFKHSSTFYRKRLCEQFKKGLEHRDFKRKKNNTSEPSKDIDIDQDVNLETPIQASRSGTSTNFPELPKFSDMEISTYNRYMTMRKFFLKTKTRC